MSNENLDDLITPTPEGGTSSETFSQSPHLQQSDPLQNRPKLRKIKRPKIRPAIDIPTPPDKVMPQVSQSSAVASSQAFNGQQTSNHVSEEDYLQETGNVSSSSETVSPNPSDALDNSEQPVSDELEYPQNSSLVRAKDAQYLTSNEPHSDLSFSLDDFANDLDYDEDDETADEILQEDSSYVKKNVLYVAAGICLFVGLFIGKAFFSSQTIENRGLEGIVANPDIPAGRPRCGLTDKSQACVFYLMNWEKQELNGRDFYKLAAYFTGREEYMIETENLRYATVKIKPGDFAQLNIPALK